MATFRADYWKLFGSSALSNLADGILFAAMPLLAVSITSNPVAVAGITAAQAAPGSLLGVLSGAAVDRVDRRQLLLMVNVVRCLVLLALVATIAAGSTALPLLYVAAFVLGLGEALYDNAAQVSVARLVPEPLLESANGRLTTAAVIGNEFVGPPAGGYLFGLAVVLPFASNAGALALAAVLILWLPKVFRPLRPATATNSIRGDVAEGLVWLARHRFLRSVAFAGAALSLIDGAWFALLVLYTVEVLRLPSTAFGLLIAIGGLGGVGGGLLASRISRLLGPPWALLSSLILAAVAQVAIGLTSTAAVAGAALAASSFAFAVWNVVAVSLRQTLIPDRLLGRVNGAYRALLTASAAVGPLLGGGLAVLLGIRAPCCSEHRCCWWSSDSRCARSTSARWPRPVRLQDRPDGCSEPSRPDQRGRGTATPC